MESASVCVSPFRVCTIFSRSARSLPSCRARSGSCQTAGCASSRWTSVSRSALWSYSKVPPQRGHPRLHGGYFVQRRVDLEHGGCSLGLKARILLWSGGFVSARRRLLHICGLWGLSRIAKDFRAGDSPYSLFSVIPAKAGIQESGGAVVKGWPILPGGAFGCRSCCHSRLCGNGLLKPLDSSFRWNDGFVWIPACTGGSGPPRPRVPDAVLPRFG